MIKNLLKNTELNGYTILDIFPKKFISQLEKKVLKKINLKLKKLNLPITEIKSLSRFHKLKISSDQKSKIFDPKDRFIPLERIILKEIKKNKFINKVLFDQWGHNKYSIKWVASLKKKQIKSNVCGFRICEPKKKAVGAHIDLHVGGKILKDRNSLISIWLPIVGFSKKYTLKFSPKSHLFDHPTDQFAMNNNTISNVFNQKYVNKFAFTRLNLKKGQGIMFNCNLLHGNSINDGKLSRVSLEIRLYNSKNYIKWKPKIN